MAENMEYQRPRTHSTREKKNKHSHSYAKKLVRQFVFSTILFVMLCPPNAIGSELSAKIRAVSKSALTYKVNTESLTSTIKQFFPKATENPKEETEVPTNESTSQNTENL